MKVVIVVAIGSNYAIGKNGRMPWTRQRSDMKHFVNLTMGFPIIMGRKTYESIPGRPLPNRTNIVITRQDPYPDPNCVRARSLGEALAMAEQEGAEKAFVIGGGEIYREALPFADEIELTLFHHEFDADTKFPAIDWLVWQDMESVREDHPPDEKNEYPYSFIRLQRKRPHKIS